MKHHAIWLLFLAFGFSTSIGLAQKELREMELPPLLTTMSGASVDSRVDWEEKRKPEILRLFESEVYGKVPAGKIGMRIKIDKQNDNALGGRAISKSVTLEVEGNGKTVAMNLFLYLPKKGEGPYPTFLGLNFYGNHTIHPDPDIPITKSWARNSIEFCIDDNTADAVSRGVRYPRWPVERLIERGYGLAVVYSGDIDPDYDDDFVNGVHQLFDEKRNGQNQKNKKKNFQF